MGGLDRRSACSHVVQGSETSVDTFLCTVDVCTPSGKPGGMWSMNCRLYVSFDPYVPHLGIYLEEMSTEGEPPGPGNMYAAPLDSSGLWTPAVQV